VAGRVRRHELVVAAVAAALAGVSLAAWASGRPGWVAMPPSHAAMVPGSGVMVILLCIATAARGRLTGVVAAALALGAAGSALIFHGWDWRFPLGHVVLLGRLAARAEWANSATHSAASTAWTVTLLAAGLLADRSGLTWPPLRVAGRVAGAAGGLLAASVILSEVGGVAGFSLSSQPPPVRGVSTVTALALGLLASAASARAMSASRRELVYGTGSFSRAARRVVGAAIVVPVVGVAVADALGARLPLHPADQTALATAIVVVTTAGVTLVVLDRLRLAADERDLRAERRLRVAAQREAAADERSRIADRRNAAATDRERWAEVRQAMADERDRIADRREAAIRERDRADYQRAQMVDLRAGAAVIGEDRSETIATSFARWADRMADDADALAAFLEKGAPSGEADRMVRIAAAVRECARIHRRNAVRLRNPDEPSRLEDLPDLPLDAPGRRSPG